MALISIIVPVYNTEPYLEQCLNSLVNQSLKDIEIIVVDDGSPDKSFEIYNKFAASDPRVKIIRKENAGVSEARNTGMDMATSSFFMFVDSDDWMPLNGCEILYNEYLRTKADLVVADVYKVVDGKIKRCDVFKNPFTTEDPDFIKKYQKSCIGYCYNPDPAIKWNIAGLGSPWNKLYNKRIIEEHNLRFDPYVKGIYDDNLFTLHYLMHVNRVTYVKEPVYYYKTVSGSLTEGYKKNLMEINSRIFQRINEFIEETGDVDFYKEAFYVYVIRSLSRAMQRYIFSPDNEKSKHEKYAELKQILKTEPYYTAVRKVDFFKLMNTHKTVVICARLKSPRLMLFCMNTKKSILIMRRR